MNRRRFLRQVSGDIARAAAEGIDPSAALPSAPEGRHSTGAITVPTAGPPRRYKPGDWVLVEDALAWLGLDEIGFYALDAVCPHLGCLVRHVGGHFFCPCHGSRFALKDGARIEGAAPTGLRALEIELDGQGNLVIRRDRPAHPDDRFIA